MRLSRSPLLVIRLAWICLACCEGSQCSGNAAREPTPPPLTDAEFEPPNEDGWGQAAGLHYLEVVKGGDAPDDSLPMVVFLHGGADRARDVWLQHAAVPMRLIMPQAPLPVDAATPADATSFTWFWSEIGDGQSAHLARKLAEAGDQLARAIALVRTHRPTRGRPIVAGFSQGGMLSYDMAVRHPEDIAGAVPLAGLLPQSLFPKHRLADSPLPPVHAMHGDADELVPLAAARKVIAYLVAQGHVATLDIYRGAKHGMPTKMAKQLESTVNALATELAPAESRRVVP